MCPTPGPQCWGCENSSKYRCPKCEVRSCSLGCVQRHKAEAGCDGVRDRVKYLPVSKFTDLDVVSDFRLLEEVSQQVDKYVVIKLLYIMTEMNGSGVRETS